MLTFDQLKPLALAASFGVMTACAIKTAMAGNMMTLDFGFFLLAAIVTLTAAICLQMQLKN